LRYFSEFAYLPGVLRKSSRSRSHLLMSSCSLFHRYLYRKQLVILSLLLKDDVWTQGQSTPMLTFAWTRWSAVRTWFTGVDRRNPVTVLPRLQCSHGFATVWLGRVWREMRHGWHAVM